MNVEEFYGQKVNETFSQRCYRIRSVISCKMATADAERMKTLARRYSTVLAAEDTAYRSALPPYRQIELVGDVNFVELKNTELFGEASWRGDAYGDLKGILGREMAKAMWRVIEIDRLVRLMDEKEEEV